MSGGKPPHCLRYLNTWSSFGGTVSGGLGGAAILKEVYHWGWALWWKALSCLQGAFCFMLVVQDVSSQLSDPTAMPATCSHASLLERIPNLPGTLNPNKLFLLSAAFGYGVLSEQQKSN